MKSKNTAALSPYALFLFRLFAIALAALIITASVNACPLVTKPGRATQLTVPANP
jgi:hypothetical protein